MRKIAVLVVFALLGACGSALSKPSPTPEAKSEPPPKKTELLPVKTELLQPIPAWRPAAYEAEQDPHFLGRGFRSQMDVPLGFVPVTAIAAGTPVRASASEHATTIAVLGTKHIALADGGACHWYTFHPGAESSPGRIRCGDVTDEMLLPVFAIRTTGDFQWIRIVADTRGRHGWLSTMSRVETIAEVFKRNIGYTTRYFDHRLYDSPTSSGRAKRTRWKINDAAFKILDTQTVNDSLWFKLEFLLDECMHNRKKTLGVGWVPLVNDNGQLQLWYERSC